MFSEMTPEWRYYLLVQLEQPEPGSHWGGWEIQPEPLSQPILGEAIEEWNWDRDQDILRFFRVTNPNNTRIRVVGVRYIPLDLAMEHMAQRMGIVENARDYAKMYSHELQMYRGMLENVLLEPHGYDFGTSAKIYRERRTDKTNPINRELDILDELLKEKDKRWPAL